MAGSAGARRLEDGSGWALWQLPAGVRGYVIALPLLAVAVAVWLVRGTAPAGREMALGCLLLACGGASVEASRRLGEPAGTVVKDLLSAWWLPLAVLLPPVFVLLAPWPLMALTQWRVRPALLHRRVFSAAVIGLSYAAASWVFHALFPGPVGLPLGPGRLAWVAAVAAAGVAAAALNALLVAVAVKAADPQTRWGALLWDSEDLRRDALEVCAGVIVAVMVGLGAVLVAVTLPPVLLLQRGLLHAQLRAAARHDPKTGLLNAVTWEREAASTLQALRRDRQPVAVLLIDIDHFKDVNDTHGHLVGDQVLRAVASTLSSGMRDQDLLARFGGEEFVALLVAADAAETDLIAERLRQQVAGLSVPVAVGLAVTVTVSIGVAAVSRSRSLAVADLLAAADVCMYRAKEAGRNQVVTG